MKINRIENLIRVFANKVDFKYRVCAIMVKKNKIISIGINKPLKTHPLTKKYDPHKTMHAEIDAIVGNRRDEMRNATVYVGRIDRDNGFRNSKPCHMCENILRDTGIHTVYFTTGNGWDSIAL